MRQLFRTLCYNVYMTKSEATDLKKPISMRVSNEGILLMDLLAKKLGVNRTAITEIAVRQMAEREGVKSDSHQQNS